MLEHEIWEGESNSLLVTRTTLSEINESVSAQTKHGQRVYGAGIYLNFENGILTSYQLSR